jgi:hypothetical protein
MNLRRIETSCLRTDLSNEKLKAADPDERPPPDSLVAGHTAVATFRDFEPIPFGIGERLDGLVLTGGALRIRDRRERCSQDESGSKSDDGLREHCHVPLWSHTPILV